MDMDEMNDKRKIAIIAFIFLICVVCFCFVYSKLEYRYFFLVMLFYFFNQLFSLFLYAVIPCAIAVVLRVIFRSRALKWIAVAATVLGVLCCLLHIVIPETTLDNFNALEYILLPEEALEDFKAAYPDTVLEEPEIVNHNDFWVFAFTQFALTSSVPVLYCVAFAGNLYSFPFIKKSRSILFALVPSLMFFLSLLLRHAMIREFGETMEFIFDESMILLLLTSLFFTLWALFIIFISLIIYMLINRFKIKKNI